MELRDYYADPDRYQAEYAPFSADQDWYVRRCAAAGGPVLELGCGTGRILFALAARGLAVDGIDDAPAMLDRARTRALLLDRSTAERVGLFAAGMADFSLGRRYRSIIAPLNALMHLLDDAALDACLARVRDHLAPGGRFLFDLSLPRPELLAATAAPEGVPLRRLLLAGAAYQQREHHSYDPRTRISRVRYSFLPLDRRGRPFATELRLRMFPPAVIAAHLDRAGLRIDERWGGFDEHPPDPDNDVMQLYAAAAD